MSMALQGAIVLAVSDGALRSRLIPFLQAPKASPDWDVEVFPDACAKALQAMVRDRLASNERPLLLISDFLTECDERTTGGWFINLLKEHPHGRLGTVAIMRRPARVADIDVTLGCLPSKKQLDEAIALVRSRLRYLAKPEARVSQSVSIRRISSMTELHEAYKFRHKVYKVMGYLEPGTEESHTKVDIHWTDMHSLQLAAFLDGGSENGALVGTARIILTPDAPPSAMQREWTERLLRHDRCLQREVEKQREKFAQFTLPACYTVDLSEELLAAFRGKRTLGELSRVIVHENWRGLGISRRLCEEAIRAAQMACVSSLFLECLELHEFLYANFGFHRVPRRADAERVLGVNRRMITMVRDLGEARGTEAIHPRLANAPAAPIQ
jgi:predicted GNAT family N-acyltransferase